MKTIDGKTITLPLIDTSKNVLSMKVQIYDKIGYPVDEQHLTFAGKPLHDGYTLSHTTSKTSPRLMSRFFFVGELKMMR